MTAASLSHRTYTQVFVALMILLALSVWVAQLSLGRWNFPVAMGISVAKTALIVLFFMHVLHATPLVRLIAFAGLLWLVIAGVLTFSDYLTRDWNAGGAPRFYEAAVDRIEHPPSGETP